MRSTSFLWNCDYVSFAGSFSRPPHLLYFFWELKPFFHSLGTGFSPLAFLTGITFVTWFTLSSAAFISLLYARGMAYFGPYILVNILTVSDDFTELHASISQCNQGSSRLISASYIARVVWQFPPLHIFTLHIPLWR